MLDGGVEDARQSDEGRVDRLVAEHDPALAALVADHGDRQGACPRTERLARPAHPAKRLPRSRVTARHTIEARANLTECDIAQMTLDIVYRIRPSANPRIGGRVGSPADVGCQPGRGHERSAQLCTFCTVLRVGGRRLPLAR